MDDITKDSRFSHIGRDPRFRKIPRGEKKVKIDKRFQLMFKDKNFKLNYVVDKRGRPVVGTSNEDLKKYYDVSSSEDDDDEEEEEGGEEEEGEEAAAEEEEEEKGKEYAMQSGGDYARGEVLLSDSSSDEESSEAGTEEEEEELDHGWGELDRDAERTDEITNRLALCHMDWDRIRAVDLMILFNSFLSVGERIHSVSICPSEFGLKRMKEEEIKGPQELVDGSNNVKNDGEDEGEEENEEGNSYSMEKLRQYQLNRLKYFYAVIVFDSPQTANKIYTECDGLEYESSATRLDLRFIPDDTTFDEEPREVCDKIPDISKYQPRYFTTTALQQAKVELTWDETNPERNELNKKLSSGQVDGISEADLRDYLASSSEDESGDEDEKRDDDGDKDKNENTIDPVSKYRSLLREIEEQEEKKKLCDTGLEITWGVGLKDKATKLVQEKLKEKNKDLTPFEQYVQKQKEKKQQKKREKRKRDTEGSGDEHSGDDIPSDIDMTDPYFQEEFQGKFKKNKRSKKEKKNNERVTDNEEEAKKQEAELGLLLMSDAQERNHFSLKSIQKQQSESKKKQKKKKLKKTNESEIKEDGFEVNVKDERFSALYSSHHFNIDPTDPHYHKTKGMDALRAEKINYRQNDTTYNVPSAKTKKLNKVQKDPELSALIKSIKRKTQHKESR